MKALLITLLVGLFILVGAILGNILKNNKKFIDISIGLALGVMILLLILDIIPEAYELLSDSIEYKWLAIVALIISGIVGFVSNTNFFYSMKKFYLALLGLALAASAPAQTILDEDFETGNTGENPTPVAKGAGWTTVNSYTGNVTNYN